MLARPIPGWVSGISDGPVLGDPVSDSDGPIAWQRVTARWGRMGDGPIDLIAHGVMAQSIELMARSIELMAQSI